MTTTSKKLRSLFLTALMVFSVFAGTVALSGAAAAANEDASITDAVEYTDPTDSDQAKIEIQLDQQIADVNNGETGIAVPTAGISAVNGTLSKVSGTTSTYTVDVNTDVTPNQNLTIKVIDAGTQVASATDITVTSTTIEESGTDHNSQATAATVRHGEPIAFLATDTGSTVEFASITGETGAGSAIYTYDSGNLDTGKNYSVQFDNTKRKHFRIQALGLSASAQENNITTDDALKVDVQINRPGGGHAVLKDSNGDTVEEMDETLQGGKTTTFDFGSDIDAGEYTVEVTDKKTGSSVTTDTINVTKAGEGSVSWGEADVVEQDAGDIAEIPIRLENSDKATITIGNHNEDGYTVYAEVTDGDGNGNVTLRFNSYAAGDGAANVLSVADSDDSVDASGENTSVVGPSIQTGESGDADLLDAGQYEMTAAVGHNGYNFEADTLGTLSLQKRSTENLTTYVAPGGATPADWDAGAISAGMGSNITQSDEVAHGDYLVAQVDASGLSGVIDSLNGDNVTEALLTDDASGHSDNVFANGADDSTGADELLQLNVTQSSPGQNQQAKQLNLNTDNTIVVQDTQNDSYYFVVNTKAVTNADADDSNLANDTQYDIQFSVKDGLLNTDGKVTSSFEKVKSDLSYDTNDDDVVTVEAASNQPITGTTNLAPGTELTFKVSSNDQTSPFLTRPTANVTTNGTFSAPGDYSKLAPGANLTISVDGFSDQDAVVVEQKSTPTPTPAPDNNNTTETPTPTPTPSPTPSPTDEPSGNESSPSPTSSTGPGFTIVAALGALIAAALLAVRRND